MWHGGVLCFVDSDDMLAPGHLQALWDGLCEGRGEFVSGTYSNMSEGGRVLGVAEKTRTHGAPWSRLYTRDQWKDIRFPEGFWFEDTLMAYCVKSRYREVFVPDAGYLYRQRSDSITASHKGHPKSLDTYWIVEEMLDWCRALGVPLTSVYRQTVRQFGPLLVNRTEALGEDILRSVFVLACDLLQHTYGGVPDGLAMDGGWGLLEDALWGGNYTMWREACR